MSIYKDTSKDISNNIDIKILSGVIGLGTILVLGAYGYTWIELRSEKDEKHDWRQSHEIILDKRFYELKQGQEKIENIVTKNSNETNNLLQQILNEQQRSKHK
jgi:hypothetical protein